MKMGSPARKDKAKASLPDLGLKNSPYVLYGVKYIDPASLAVSL